MKKRIITLLTDFGDIDHYVAAMKGRILGIADNVELVDVSHKIPAQDVGRAAFLLEQYWLDFPPETIHLCVVDPGVGSARKPIAVHYDKRIYIGPDNGCMTNLVQKNHRWKARLLDDSRYHAKDVCRTFHGRDIFAPVAGHLAQGLSFDDLGTTVTEIVMLESQPVLMGTNKISGRIVHIDYFGNLITNIRADHFEWSQLEPESAGLQAGPHIVGRFVETYNDAEDEPVMLFGSSGLLEIAVRNGSAHKTLGLRQGSEVNLMKVDKLLSI